MKRSARKSLIAIFIIALIASSCKGDTTNSENEGNTTALPAVTSTIAPEKPEPRTLAESTIDVTLEDRPAVTAIIGAEGGSLSTVDANGNEFTLVIPQGALLYEEEISMTPLASAEGEVIGDTFLAGVRLEPNGLHFFELVSLKITGPTIEEGAVAFTAQEDGQAFHLIPSKSVEGSLTLTTSHFSDPGVAKKELGEGFELNEEASIEWLEHQLAKLNPDQQIALLKRMTIELQRRGVAVMGLENWSVWTMDIGDLLLRYEQAYVNRKWDSNTPGIKDLYTEMSLLIDDWYIVNDDMVSRIGKKCEQGEIAYIAFRKKAA